MKHLCCFLLYTFLTIISNAEQNDYYEMAPEESEAAYDILEAINSAVPWRTLHPDNLCLFGPHGINCDADENNVLHVVEFSFGWVADNDNNPQCDGNATISPALQKLPYLRKLLFYNCFTEREQEIPPVIWSLGASLQHLVFIKNSALVGEIPGEIEKLMYLERLVLMDNGLKGSVPTEVGSLKELNQLVLSNNNLQGIIPGAVGSLQRLKVLEMSGNRLQGGIPTELSKLSKLEKLDLSSNELTGSIPPELGDILPLQLLDLSHNSLSGSLPPSLGMLRELRILQLSNNNFTHVIPDVIWSNLTLLVGLGLSNSGFHGKIPSSLGQLPHLSYLDLSRNKLEGTVPFSLGHLPRVYQINLSDNLLVGLLPFSAEFVSKLGRNLQLKGNLGLCISADWPPSPKFNGLAVEGLEICNDEYWSASLVQGMSNSMSETLSGGCHVTIPELLSMISIGFVLVFGNWPL